MTRPLRAPRVSAEAREPRRVELAPLPDDDATLEICRGPGWYCDCVRGHDAGCTCPECEPDDDDDAPTRAELEASDAEDYARECRRSLSW